MAIERTRNPVGGVMIEVAMPALSMPSSEKLMSQFRPAPVPPTRLLAAALTRKGGLK